MTVGQTDLSVPSHNRGQRRRRPCRYHPHVSSAPTEGLDALTTMPMHPLAPLAASDFLDRLRAYAERSAHALQVFGDSGT